MTSLPGRAPESGAWTLLTLAEALVEATSATQVAAAITELTAQALGTRSCQVGLLDQRRQRIRLVPASSGPGFENDTWTWLALAEDHPQCVALRTQQPLYLTDARAAEGPAAIAPPGDGFDPSHASAYLPLRARGRLIGTLTCIWDTPQVFDTQQRRLLQQLARLTGQAMTRVQLIEAQRSTAETLQRALLTDLPEPDHLQLTARYAASNSHGLVGGDWYDAFLTQDGATILVMGDVTGHDVGAAAVMGQLRSLLRGLAFENQTAPARTLQRLDRAMTGLLINQLATIVLVRIEQPADAAGTGDRVLRWSNAGHPPPLLLHADGRTELLPSSGDLLLGVDHNSARHDQTVTIEPDATLLLYTDGLIEDPTRDIDEGITQLSDRLTTLRHLPLDDLLDQLMSELSARNDDTTVLAVRFHPEDRPRPATAGPRHLPADTIDRPTCSPTR